jgi:hypothetical protein
VVRLIGAIPELREAEQAHDVEVSASLESALRHYAPDADPGEIHAAAKYMIIISHGVLSECFAAQTSDAARLLRMLRASIYSLVMPLLLPPAA